MLIKNKLISIFFAGTLLSLNLFPLFSYAETVEKTPDIIDSSAPAISTKTIVEDKELVDISSLKLSKKSATIGDTIKISLAADSLGSTETIVVRCITPLSGNDNLYYLEFNAKTKLFETIIKVDEKFENGTWAINYVWAYDLEGNYLFDEEVDSLPSGDFFITGVKAKINSPELDYDSIGVSKKLLLKMAQ